MAMNETPTSNPRPSNPQASSNPQTLSSDLQENIAFLKQSLPIGKSFDLVYRDLFLGDTPAYWLGINGFSRVELLQQLFSDLQNPLYMQDPTIDDIVRFMNAKIGYAQVTLTDSWTDILKNVLSGPSVLFIDGFARAMLIDVRTYPTRSVEEPDVEKITRGARDGFVETMLFNTNLIRRRIRSPHLVFALQTVGTESQTDVAIAYLEHSVNQDLLAKVRQALQKLKVTTLTLGSKSLEELLLNKKWWFEIYC
jgi:stage V sporulation protein AF